MLYPARAEGLVNRTVTQQAEKRTVTRYRSISESIETLGLRIAPLHRQIGSRTSDLRNEHCEVEWLFNYTLSIYFYYSTTTSTTTPLLLLLLLLLLKMMYHNCQSTIWSFKNFQHSPLYSFQLATLERIQRWPLLHRSQFTITFLTTD